MNHKSILFRLAKRLQKKNSLKRQLLNSGKTRWLDIGSVKFEPGFHCLNLWPPDFEMSDDQKAKFHQADLLSLTKEDLKRIGKFDLVRLQHVLEHFSFEDGHKVIESARELLHPGGYLLISVPDLKVFVKAYLRGFSTLPWFSEWARWRVPKDAPSSSVFSVHVHQMGYHPSVEEGRAHRWCYDYQGLEYTVSKVGGFRDIKNLGLLDPLSEIPFTHGRPNEDACLLAQKSQP